ncbi:Cof-type HAD-IIB family hydrolase [Brevibacterium samyangense]|uniref:Cof-type HAD-IIB family hydrolase n=1 Tax=Brevibacterium samyangense TaxID=366888 RepID=A0ABP5EVL2_9MICO
MADIRLVVTDMDGTLLDGNGNVPDGLWPLLDVMAERGITFVPASGRQFATLERDFTRVPGPLAFIADNGTHVVAHGRTVSVSPLGADLVTEALAFFTGPEVADRDLGVVLCCPRVAYVARRDDAFLTRVRPYYASLEVVDSLTEVMAAGPDPVVKVAVNDAESAAEVARRLHVSPAGSFAADAQTVVSGQHWIDVMAAGVHKGAALRALQDRLGVAPEETVVFGDYLNDREMFSCTPHTYAMANAHPDILAAAAHRAPANTEHGVVRVLERILGV